MAAYVVFFLALISLIAGIIEKDELEKDELISCIISSLAFICLGIAMFIKNPNNVWCFRFVVAFLVLSFPMSIYFDFSRFRNWLRKRKKNS